MKRLINNTEADIIVNTAGNFYVVPSKKEGLPGVVDVPDEVMDEIKGHPVFDFHFENKNLSSEDADEESPELKEAEAALSKAEGVLEEAKKALAATDSKDTTAVKKAQDAVKAAETNVNAALKVVDALVS